MGKWELALDLEHFIREFRPPNWDAPIEAVLFVPVVLKHDITLIQGGIIPAKFRNSVMELAIRAWLLKGKDNGKVQSQ
jgi:hypothetical protein